MTTGLVLSLLQLADDHLILGHRLSEWCGHAPMLEEDLAMPNIALDLIGQARALYSYIGEIEGHGRDEDCIAFGRIEREYRNLLICEVPNGDFGRTMLRQFYFSCFMLLFWEQAQLSSDNILAGIAAKAVKEARYHRRHCGEWVIRLGDGTEESSKRMISACEYLEPYLGELFETDALKSQFGPNSIFPDREALRTDWMDDVIEVLGTALLPKPDLTHAQSGGRDGRHTEDMGHLLTQLQYMQRTFPNMTW